MFHYLDNSFYTFLSVFSLGIMIVDPIVFYFILFKKSKATDNSFKKILSESLGIIVISIVLFIFAVIFFIEGITRG